MQKVTDALEESKKEIIRLKDLIQDSMNKRIQGMRNKQDQLMRDAGKSASMADLRAENAELRTEALTATEDLKQTLKAQEKLSREYRALEERQERLKAELAQAKEASAEPKPWTVNRADDTSTDQSEVDRKLE